MFLDGAYDRGLFEKFCDDFIRDFVLDERDFEVDGKDRSICQLGKSKELSLSVLEFSIKSEDRNKRITMVVSRILCKLNVKSFPHGLLSLA